MGLKRRETCERRDRPQFFFVCRGGGGEYKSTTRPLEKWKKREDETRGEMRGEER